VLPALDEIGLDEKFLIAAETRVINGVITDQVVTPLPYREGKRLCLEKSLNKTHPLLVAGNSMGDISMMEMASVLPLVITFLPHLSEVEASEKELIALASKRKWPRQVFRL